MREIIVECRAKINLTLDILDRRPDGFHNLESVVQSIALSDTLRICRTSEKAIELLVNRPDIPTGPSNTVYKAVSLFMELSQVESGVSVSIEKRIPHQAGLGGGSSDAAGTLIGLNKLFDNPLDMTQLSHLAAQIGSDVPYFLTGGTAVMTGRGEVVRKLPDAPKLDLLIVKPDVGVPTPWAYARLAETTRTRSNDATIAVIDSISRGDRDSLIKRLSNDFQVIVEREFAEIAEIKQAMLTYGAETAVLCGSGAAVFGVFGSSDAASSALLYFEAKYPFAEVASTSATAITENELEVEEIRSDD